MKTVSKVLATIVVTAAFTVSAAYANGNPPSPNVTAHATATVITPVTIAETTALSFGSFAPNPTGPGTIDSSGNVTGGVNKVTTGTPATFATNGVAGNSYTIVGDPNVTLNGTLGSNMVANLTYPASPRTLSGTGGDNFNVTGILNIAPGQVADSYSGTYNVSVHY